MPPSTGSSYVYCPECGTKAAAEWSFCRKCEASLDGAETANEDLIVRIDGEDVDLSEHVDEPMGCQKCGHTETTVDDLAITGNDLSRALDIESRRFRTVSCTRCGYTEFYRSRHPNEAVALFLR